MHDPLYRDSLPPIRALRHARRNMIALQRRLAIVLALGLAGGSQPAFAESIDVSVLADGAPVVAAVVTLTPLGGVAALRPVDAVMDQVGSEFSPRLLVVPKGSRVAFPNSDRIRHQVYSFSPAKRFELPLYTGTPPSPVLFDHAGVVVLGCNIHDWMKAYIVVVDTPHHATTGADGRVRIEAPAGDYLLTAWHERLPAPDAAPKRTVRLPRDTEATLSLPLAAPPPPRGSERLRALQERFRLPPGG